jgi:hypothetical protein
MGVALPSAWKLDKLAWECGILDLPTEKWPGGWPMCRYCVSGSSYSQIKRTRILDLLALIERLDALPAETALGIASKLLKWADQSEPRFQCESPAIGQSDELRNVGGLSHACR